MPNPFIDVEAEVSDNDETELRSDDDENDSWFINDNGETVGDQEEDKWEDKDVLQVHHVDNFALPTFTDYLLERYTNQSSTMSPSSITSDDTLSNKSLRAALLSDTVTQDIFWRVKCKPGYESALVTDIMRRELERVPTTTSDIPSTHSSSSVKHQAFEILCRACADPNVSIPVIESELKSMLGNHYTVQWEQALHAGSLQDPDEDPSVALKRLLELKGQLVPTNSSSISESIPTTQPTTSTLRSVFFVPLVIGFIYLEADLGLHPQDTDIVNYLRGHKAVLKNQLFRQNQGHVEFPDKSRLWLVKSQVWLERVGCEEIATLLATPMPTIRPHSLVKITCGEYHGDVGLVLARQTSTLQRRLMVLLVPRLPPPLPRHTLESDEKDSVKTK
ncbi:hypothetical protein VKT23_020346 [Stygiomarasmius scandens]|uniref:Uncharacterized protein n=1 Tax=Marasmiellus scandens TaxID=2682957 RepID=A0ABR1IJ87_9AGAR